MTTSMLKSMREEKGFTLVELAVVMIIIGLLIGGILKGQEMIANAQITSTVAQAKAIDAASSTFRDQYDAFPGDMVNATARLAGCAAPCVNGNGNSKLGGAVGTVPAAETLAFFPMLRLANLLSGYDGTAGVAFGQALPSASVGGGYTVGYVDATVAPTGFAAANLRQGHYIVLTGTPTAVVGVGTGKINPSQAARIDRKMDDGQATSGSVVLDNVNAACLLGTAYAELLTGQTCNIAIRIQN